MKRLALILALLLPVMVFAQGFRYDSQVSQAGTFVSGLGIPVLIPSGAQIAFCSFPANAVPCTNKATTFTSVTLGIPCSTSTQIVLVNTSTCIANPDAQENWGVWVAAGNYAYTITIPGFGNFGPYVLTLGTTATTATNLLGPGSISGTFSGNYTTTGNVTHNGTETFTGPVFDTTLNNVLLADQFAGADACAKINAAFLSLPARGGIVDARGIVGAQTCAVNPFVSVTAVGGLLMLGNTSIVSNAQWILPNKTRIVGIGRGGGAAGNGENTTIQAGASFPVSTGGALIRLGTGGGSFGTRLENLTLDCNGQTNCTSGIFSNDIEEKSGASYVTINNFTGNGIFVDGSGANFAQHYSFDNMEIQPLNVGTGATIGIKLTGNGTGPYELRNITVIGNAGHQILQCVDMNGTTIGGIYNLHGEGCVTILMLGDTASVANLNVVGVEPTNGGNPVTTVISLNNAGSAAITLIGIARSSASGNTLTDNITTHTSTATFIGLYAIGNGSPRTIITNDTSLVNITSTTAMVGNINMNGFGFSDGGTGIGVSPSSVNSTDLGAASLPWRNLLLGTAATNNFKFQPAATAAARVISMPDPLGAVNMPYVIASGTTTLTANAALAAVTSQAANTTAAANVVATTDAIEWSYTTAPGVGDSLCHISPYVTAGNVNFIRTNPTAAAQNVSAIIINWRVIR